MSLWAYQLDQLPLRPKPLEIQSVKSDPLSPKVECRSSPMDGCRRCRCEA